MINKLLSIFWNGEERRVKAFWRLSLQGGAWLALIVALAVPAVIVVTMVFSIPPLDIGEYIAKSEPLRLVFAVLSLAVTLITVWPAGRFLDRRKFVDFGLRLHWNWWSDLCFGLVLGAVLMALVFLVEWASGWVTIAGFFPSSPTGLPFILGILPSLVAYICVGIYEELLA